MSEVKMYDGHGEPCMAEYAYFVKKSDYDAALAREAALREELATAKRNEHNSEVAYKAAIEKQEELRKDLDWNRLCRSTSEGEWMEALTAAEQRNAELFDLVCGLPYEFKKVSFRECRDGADACIDIINEHIAAFSQPTESGESE